MRRSPVRETPVATSAAMLTTRPASRTLRYVASSHRYGYRSPGERAAPECRDLGVEGRAHAGDLTAG